MYNVCIRVNKWRSSTQCKRGALGRRATAAVPRRQTDIQVFGQHLFDHVATPITRTEATLTGCVRSGCQYVQLRRQAAILLKDF